MFPMGKVVGLLIVIWLIVGVVAAAQRGYFNPEKDVNCRTTSDTVLTVVAGPLNYVGVNPKVKCMSPSRPSERATGAVGQDCSERRAVVLCGTRGCRPSALSVSSRGRDVECRRI